MTARNFSFSPTLQNDVFPINYISIEFTWRQGNKGKDLFEEILNNIVY